jgi:hypothetical protein
MKYNGQSSVNGHPGRVDIRTVMSLTRHLQVIADGGTPFGPLPLHVSVAPTSQARSAERKRPATAVMHASGVGVAQQQEAAPGGAQTATAPEGAEWPEGPLINNRAVGAPNVARIVAAILDDAERGVDALTCAELRRTLLRIGFDGPMAGRTALPLVVWMVNARVLCADADAELWCGTYRLATTDGEQIRERLRHTPPPTPEAVQAAKVAGLK